ncbi:sulfate permease [Hysterangium stoloniferum]|nr:sulfate permease [Hysterangium stoloniferum]
MAMTSGASTPQRPPRVGKSSGGFDILHSQSSSIQGLDVMSDIEHGEQVHTSNANNAWWQKVKLRSGYYLPGRSYFRRVENFGDLKLGGDVLAGVTVACLLVPQSISYATSLAKLNPLTGLFSASIPGIIYSVLGSSRQLNVAPEAALSLLVGQAVQDILIHPLDGGDKVLMDFIAHNPKTVAAAVSTIITLQAGLMTFLLGIFRLGFIDVILSRALLRGFVTAVAVVILIEQCIPIFGLSALEYAPPSGDPPESTLDKALFLFKYIFIDPRAHWLTAFIGFGTLAALLVIRAAKRSASKRCDWPKWIPEVLLVVIVSTCLSAVFDWEKAGVVILGRVEPVTDASFFAFPIHSLNYMLFKRTASTAILISIVGFLDSIAAAKQNALRFGYSISPNRELVALGAGNLAASFIPGTLPAYGSITRSRLNADCGGRTQMASIISSILILLATFFLLPTLYYLPKAVLSSIVCLIVWGLVVETPHDVKYYLRMKAWRELFLMTLTLVLTILWSVEVGVLSSVALSLLLVVKKSSQTRMSILGRMPGTDQWKPINENPEAIEPLPGVLIVRVRESLDFANSAQMKERLRRLELYGVEHKHPSEAPTRQHAQVIVFHLADMDNCDVAATQVFFELIEAYKNRAVNVFVCHLRPGPNDVFEKAGVIDLLGRDAVFENVTSAMQHIEVLELVHDGGI